HTLNVQPRRWRGRRRRLRQSIELRLGVDAGYINVSVQGHVVGTGKRDMKLLRFAVVPCRAIPKTGTSGWRRFRLVLRMAASGVPRRQSSRLRRKRKAGEHERDGYKRTQLTPAVN